MKEWFKLNWISLFAIAISVMALYASCRNNPFEISFEGALIVSVATILSVPTAILVGFQLYNYFKIDKLRKEIQDIKNEVLYESNKNLLLTHFGLATFFTVRYNDRAKEKNSAEEINTIYYGAIQYCSFTLVMCPKFNDAGLFDRTLTIINTLISDISILNKEQTETIISYLDKIPKSWRFKNFDIIYSRIVNYEAEL